jgi:hypothetical protein
VDEHDRVVVHVHDPGGGVGGLGHLMGVAGGRQPGANVQELADAALAGQVAHRPGEERPAGPDVGDDPRIGGDRLLGGITVGGEVVFAA